jgi:AraC family transcriptional regulator, transcriptional activator of pobA
MKLPLLNFNRPDGKKLEFELVEISNSNLPNTPTKHHRHNFFEILIVEKNSATHIVDFKTYTVSEDEILIIPKNSVHNTTENDKYEGKWLLFTDTFFNQEQSKTLNLLSIFNPIIDNKLLKCNLNIEINKYIDILNIEYSKKEIEFLVLQNLLFTLLLKLESIAQVQYETNIIVTDQNTYFAFINLLEDKFKTEHKVSFYSKTLNATPKKINSVLVKITGKTISELILERVIIEAKRLLVYSEKSIKEIAYNLGFEDNYYFSRTFKKQTKLSPELFRNSFAEKSIKKD